MPVEYSKERFSCEVLDGLVTDDKYWVMKEVIYYRDQIYLVPRYPLKGEDSIGFSSFTISRAPGFTKTYETIKDHLRWEGLKDDVLRHI